MALKFDKVTEYHLQANLEVIYEFKLLKC